MIPLKKEYEDKKYNFPNRGINPKLKDEDYCRKNAEAIYSLYMRNKTAFSPKAYDSFNTLRLYSNGQQSTDQYKSWLLEDDNENETGVTTWDETTLNRTAKREGWYNMLWDNVSPAPKIMAMIHGMFDDVEWDVSVDTIDKYSKKLLEEEKYKRIIEGKEAEWQNEYKKNAGIPIDEDMVLPRSKEEFDMTVEQDGFKLNIAKAMEKLIDHTFDVSRWDNVLKRKLVDDLAALGYAAVKDYYDPEDGFFKTKYIDIAKFVMQYSSETDYTDSEYAGYFTETTITQLRQKRPDLTEEQLHNLAEKSLGYEDNPDRSADWSSYYSLIDPASQTYRYDEFKIPVFEVEWVDFDKEKRLKITNAHGDKRYIRKDFEEDVKDKTTKSGVEQKVMYVEKRRIYGCSWVVGSDIVYDYGKVQMAARPTPSKPRMSFHVEQLMQPSYIKQLKPMLDQIQLIWLRWQNSLAKMIERGYAVNMSMLQNITDGEKKWRLEDVVKMWKQTGILPFMQSVSGSYQGGDVTPIREVAGGLGTRLEETAVSMDIQFKLIEQIVGFNPATMGTTPAPGEAVRNVQAAMQATNNVLKPLIKAVMEVKAEVAKTTMSRLQVGIRASQTVRDSYSGVVNDNDIKLMQLADKDQVRYGLSMKARPDAAFRAQLSEYVKAALQSGRDGKAGLEMPEAMYIDEQLYRGGNMTDIRHQIQYLMRKNKQEVMANEKQNIQLQNDGLANIQKQKTEDEMRSKQMDAQIDMNKTKAEGNLEIAKSRFDANNELLMKLVDAATNNKEGVDNTEAKRRLSIALNVIGRFGMNGIDLAQKLGETEGAMGANEQINKPTASIESDTGTISTPTV